ncbi:MAG: IPT/TIG domain-containing protein [Cytophagales bacterium]|nr:IPT/TIG domain-containing protein [Cytophagales bacterium]
MINKIRYFLILCAFLLVRCESSDENPIEPASISEITPLTGQPGTLVKIRGKNFSKNALENIVKFNGVRAEIAQVNDTLMEVVAPILSKSGLIEIEVRKSKIIGPEFRYYHLYTYGRSNYAACFWKDGIQTTLNSVGHVNDLVVSGEDIHAIGFEFLDAIKVPKYWKNNQSIPLEGTNSQTELTGIVVSNGDVYICGYQRGTYPINRVAKYWKNGILTFSSTVYDFITASPNDIAVIGNDVYMVGQEYPNAVLWRNGVPTPLEGTGICSAERILINDSDIHIVGVEGLGFYSRIFHWKNDIRMAPLEVNGHAYDISIHNSDVYISGYGYGEQMGTTVAKYWVNGLEKISSPISPNRYIAAIEVTDDAIYLLNNQFGELYPYFSVLTKNGQVITPDYGPGVVGSIDGMTIVYY